VPNEGLGFRICPDGNQQALFDKVYEDITKICKALSGAYITERMSRQALQQRIAPKIRYPLHLSSFEEAKHCDKLNAPIKTTLLPSMGINRNVPDALVYGPEEYGGMEMPEVYTMQDQVQLEYMLKQLRWDKTVANDLLVTLDNIQLDTGQVKPILWDTRRKIEYVDKGLLISLRNRMCEIGAQLWIESAWTPPLQREKDASIMEAFMEIKGIKRWELEAANRVRLYLRVVTIADLANVKGDFIPAGQLTGRYQAGSNLEFPHQPCPHERDWQVFRRCLRKTFCKFVSGYVRPSDSLALDVAL